MAVVFALPRKRPPDPIRLAVFLERLRDLKQPGVAINLGYWQ
jgi:hypothetical protein